ncbi:IS110 family transposase [Alteromonas sp. W364]|jgi:transposase|uniref:IS110 family transposase n=1 Tax=Alteromonas sp. W364 TaxID=3075610 RepID=UPI002885F027|nr:IS110 family transposase [Alteromonas sp. W364]MDT0630104.1 IS110 family transposase [Alteromonas sp. W364]
MNNIKRKFAVHIGLDWANKKHDVCVQIGDSKTRSFEVIPHLPEAIDTWLHKLHVETKGDIAVAVELTKGPIVYALQKHSFVTVFPIHGLTLSQYRKALYPSGAKDDPMDAELALDMMLNYPDKVKPLKPSSGDCRALALLVEQRRALVDDRRSNANKLISALKQYYPQPLEWFSHRDSELFCDFLIKWPTLESVKRARNITIEKFFMARGGNSLSNITKRVEGISSAVPLTEDNSVILPHKMLTIALCKQILTLIQNIRVYDKQIALLFKSLPDAELFESLPGTGPCLAPRLLAALGEDRTRFNNAQEIQNYAGLSPVTERSGQKSWVHWRWQCSKFIRQSFIEWAAKSVGISYWAGLYYAQQRAKGNTHQSAVRSLAYKWVRILYRCWKTKTPYDESKYLKVLRERNSPLLAA